VTTQRGEPADPAAVLRQLFPGLAWGQTMMETAGRAQAALAAETLRRLNAPAVEALAHQRELLGAMRETSANLSALAVQLDTATRQYAELLDQVQAVLDPYLRVADLLAEAGSGEGPADR
jgi:hypothetical protein